MAQLALSGAGLLEIRLLFAAEPETRARVLHLVELLLRLARSRPWDHPIYAAFR